MIYKIYIRNFSGIIKMKLKILIPIIFIIILLCFVLACTSIIRGFVGPYIYAPTWSPDSEKIAFTSFVSSGEGKEEIYVMDADGSNQVNLTNNPENDSDPIWSPDGKKITFESNRDGNMGPQMAKRLPLNPIEMATWKFML
jgi:Tol biopolymer transport system component